MWAPTADEASATHAVAARLAGDFPRFRLLGGGTLNLGQMELPWTLETEEVERWVSLACRRTSAERQARGLPTTEDAPRMARADERVEVGRPPDCGGSPGTTKRPAPGWVHGR